MKANGMLVLAAVLVSANAWADASAPVKNGPPAVTAQKKEVSTSSLAGAEKRSETTVINVNVTEQESIAPRRDVDPTLVLGSFPTVSNTKAEAKSDAGKQNEVAAPKASAVVQNAAPPAAPVVRAVAGMMPKLKACVAKPRGAVTMSVTIAAAGDIHATMTKGTLEAEEATCAAHAIETAKIRGARGTTSQIELSL